MGGDPPAGGDGVLAGLEGVAAGSRVARYLLVEQIGQGGMAVVFLARDERLGRQVALKVLSPALAADQAFRRRFIRESQAAAAADDPHIIPVFEADESGGVLFIAMRYVAGGDVRTMLRRDGPLPPSRAAAIVSPVASALDAAHALGLVHRDVKPENMLLDVRPGRPAHVYLSDFGISKDALSVSLTATGAILGSPRYMSPEQFAGPAVDGRADQYALACAAYELLAGVPPFQHDHWPALMNAHLSEPPPLLAAARPGLPAAADAVLGQALAKNPADRYPSCQAFAEALRAALQLPPYDAEPQTPAPEHPATVAAGPARPAPPDLSVTGGAAVGSAPTETAATPRTAAASRTHGPARAEPQPPEVAADAPGAGQDVPAEAVPARPGIERGERWSDSPFAVVDEGRYTIGWQYVSAQDGGPCFATLRRSRLGLWKIVERYPLTEEGWASAWRSLTILDKGAAVRARRALTRRELRRGDSPGRKPEPAVAGSPGPRSGAGQDVPAEAVPARPGIERGERWSDSPFAVVDEGRYTIGWQYVSAQDGGPCFATLRRSRLGLWKIVERYPLTEEGWASAWRSLTILDKGAAVRARRALTRRELRRGDSPGRKPEPAS